MNQQEVINSDNQNESVQRNRLHAVGAGALHIAMKHSPEVVRRRGMEVAVRRLIRSEPCAVQHLFDEVESKKALELEQAVWHEKGYGDLGIYDIYLPQSRIFAAYDSEGSLIGMNRLFAGSPEIPPFIKEMTIYDEALKDKLIEDGKSLKVEEYGTVALTKEKRGSRAFLDICRVAFRDASERGVEAWGIVMEPERVQKMNDAFAFTFKQIGPAVDYQGGDCASHLMNFTEAHANMSSTKPELYDWFINQPL